MLKKFSKSGFILSEAVIAYGILIACITITFENWHQQQIQVHHLEECAKHERAILNEIRNEV